MAVRYVILENHKNRSCEYGLKHSLNLYFVKIPCNNWQVALGIHDQVAIDHVKFMIEEDGDDLKDFDYVSFDYHEGYFIEHMFSRPQILNGWGQGLIEIR